VAAVGELGTLVAPQRSFIWFFFFLAFRHLNAIRRSFDFHFLLNRKRLESLGEHHPVVVVIVVVVFFRCCYPFNLITSPREFKAHSCG
jgi:hypothetical protein